MSTPDTNATAPAKAPAKKATTKTPAPKKAPAKKAATPEFNPTVSESGRLDHTNCGHPKNLAGRSACRAAQKAAK